MNGRKMTKAGAASIAALALSLGACDGPAPDSAPGAVSEGEAKALEDAADMLDEQRLPDGVLPVIETPRSTEPTGEAAPTATDAPE